VDQETPQYNYQSKLFLAAQFEISFLRGVILSLRRIWRAADIHRRGSRAGTR
jgi:hypothetical protein